MGSPEFSYSSCSLFWFLVLFSLPETETSRFFSPSQALNPQTKHTGLQRLPHALQLCLVGSCSPFTLPLGDATCDEPTLAPPD